MDKLMIDNAKKKFALTQKIIIYALPILAVTGILVPLIFGQYNLSLLGSYLAFPLILAPLIFVKFKKRLTNEVICPDRWFISLVIFYFLFFLISILLLYVYDVRPLTYYLVVAFIAAIISLEVLLFKISKIRYVIILCQNMLLIVNILFGVTLKYFYFISRTDPIAHARLIESIIYYGHVTEGFGLYQSFPLWHILVSLVHITSDISIPLHKLMFFTNGIIYAFMMPLIYLASLKIFKDKKIALISTLFAVIYPDILAFGMGSLPRSVVSFLFILLIVIYEDSLPKKVLTIILTFSLVIYHHASMPFILSILALIYIGQKIYLNKLDKKFVNLNYLMLMLVVAVSYWMYCAYDIFITFLHNSLAEAPIGGLTKAVLNTPLTELINYLQYVPIIFLAIFGILSSLQSKRFFNYERIFFLVGLALSSVSFPGPSLLINKLAKNLNIGRFGEYGSLFIILASAYGFYELFSRSKRFGKILIISLFIMMVFLLLSNDFIASDNPLVKRPFYSFYLTENEVDSSFSMARFTSGYTMSDYVITRFISFSPYVNKSHLLEVDFRNMSLLRNNDSDSILIRKSELNKRPLDLYSSEDGLFKLDQDYSLLEYYYLESPLWASLTDYNKIYDSNEVAGYN